MTQEAEKSKVLKDVIEALSSAGISSEITDVVASNLLNENQHLDLPIDGLPLSDNARFIIENHQKVDFLNSFAMTSNQT